MDDNGDTSSSRTLWRSLEDSSRGARPGAAGAEFGFGASDWMPGMDRKEFLRLMGASLALGGLSGCIRPSRDSMVPYVAAPEDGPVEDPTFYASTMPVEGFGRGILVETHFGRPTKIEGNPDHPESQGASDATTQASVLGLYDPDRSRVALREGKTADWAAFEAEWERRRPGLASSRGEGFTFLTEPTTSPTLLRQVRLFLEDYPRATWYQHTPLPVYTWKGGQEDYSIGSAEVILSLGSDFLFRHPASLRYSRQFAEARRHSVNGGMRPRLYVIEASPTPTGSLADARLPASPGRMRAVLGVVASMMAGTADLEALSTSERRFVDALVADLRDHSPRVACIAGAEQRDDIQAWARSMNLMLGDAGGVISRRTALRSDGDPRCTGDARELASAVESGSVATLVILSSNPAYTSPEFRGAKLLSKVPFTIHLGSHVDETARECTWHLPETHFLETWGDLRGYDGTGSFQQPMIEPLFGGRSAIEFLSLLRTGIYLPGYEIVRETWSARADGDFELWWADAVRKGLFPESPSVGASRELDRPGFPAFPALMSESGASLVLVQDPTIGDGRWANNAWLQELPKPASQLVWDNAALLSPAFASRLGISSGDMILLSAGGLHAEAAAWVMPGHAPDCVSLSLGYGRTAAGSVGNGRGFSAYVMRPDSATWEIDGLQVRRTGGTYALVSTQRHFSMEGRNPVRIVGEQERPADPTTSLYPDWKPGAYSWGMSIDLGACLGCNACVVACQAENNIPVVGKQQVAREREMHWIRIDRYFDGDAENPRILSQPVTCMHCEKAPCEVVCPVGATVHNDEGLNEMVYNRCVGTRYCSNNCPYKVRRFNFLDYRLKADSPQTLQENPQVSVRDRGVMEKCTYCVQRINTARIRASKEDRPIRDGEILTACQQACPTGAIVFGNIADPSSAVARRKAQPASYSLLGELNTRPRTTYLARPAGITGT